MRHRHWASEMKPLKQYVALNSSTGELYKLAAVNDDGAYRLIARVILGMGDAADPDFDTGNVDFDLYEIGGAFKRQRVQKLELGD